ncbi:MAG: sigma-70 family RNA polymerase sigma factor [Candidatus Omnitrophica bacterium]|nr:sigma-70 family RNA polymerase sigma factor [Candidatus Omnitrophota bacterium]
MDKDPFTSQFVKKYVKLVYTAIEKRLRGCGITLGHEEILDIQQDILASICAGKKLNNVRNPDSIPYWIAIVSGNAAMQYMRNRRRIEPEKMVSLSDKIGETELIELIPSSGPTPPEELGKDELSEKIDEAMERLPPKERLIIKLNLLHDKKYEEIADILNLPKGTVSNYIKRAKGKLKKHLEEFK